MSTSLNSIDEAQKGIVTQEGRKMAAKKFQVDDKKADKDGDGAVSTKERVTAEATQKNEIPEIVEVPEIESVEMEQPEDLEALDDVVAGFRDRNEEVVCINGGDGSLGIGQIGQVQGFHTQIG